MDNISGKINPTPMITFKYSYWSHWFLLVLVAEISWWWFFLFSPSKLLKYLDIDSIDICTYGLCNFTWDNLRFTPAFLFRNVYYFTTKHSSQCSAGFIHSLNPNIVVVGGNCCYLSDPLKGRKGGHNPTRMEFPVFCLCHKKISQCFLSKNQLLLSIIKASLIL